MAAGGSRQRSLKGAPACLPCLQVITRTASTRVAEYAFKYASDHGRAKVGAGVRSMAACRRALRGCGPACLVQAEARAQQAGGSAQRVQQNEWRARKACRGGCSVAAWRCGCEPHLHLL